MERNGTAPRQAAGIEVPGTDAQYIDRVCKTIDAHYKHMGVPEVRFVKGEPKSKTPDVAEAFEQAAAPQPELPEPSPPLSRAD
jgi:hypothetical protein